MKTKTVEVAAKTVDGLVALSKRLGLHNPIHFRCNGNLWVATFWSEEELHRQQIEQQLISMGY